MNTYLFVYWFTSVIEESQADFLYLSFTGHVQSEFAHVNMFDFRTNWWIYKMTKLQIKQI